MNIPATVRLCREKIDALKAMDDAMTPTPWKWADWHEDDGDETWTLEGPPNPSYVPPPRTDWTLPYRVLTDEHREVSQADKDGIAAFRNLAPGLLAYIEADVNQCEYDWATDKPLPHEPAYKPLAERLRRLAAALGVEVVE